MMTLVGCAQEPAAKLPNLDGDTYSVKITPENSTLTADALTSAKQVTLNSSEDETVQYTFEFSAGVRLNSSHNEFTMPNETYLKSVSTYKVERIIVDYFYSKGTNFSVYANTDHSGTALEAHASTITPTDPDDGGKVIEFNVNANGWSIYNSTVYKPSFYYIEIVFRK